MYKAFLIDLDGTAYLGTKAIQTTVDFVNNCQKKGIKILFVTNNASATPKQVQNKLNAMGYNIKETEILTSAMAMAAYYKEQKRANKPYVIGDQGLCQALTQQSLDFVTNLDYEKSEDLKTINTLTDVIVGYNNKATFKDLGVASLVLQKENSLLFATNKDLIIPTNLGGLPGNGSYVNLLEQVNRIQALQTGKPTNIMLEQALKILNLTKKEVCMIGDNYHTDILFGLNNGIHTIFVEGGVSSLQYVTKQDLQPTYLLKDLSYFALGADNA
ncbi:MAG: HAD-IIA family hydrolase [Mycoplasmatales bacterium]